MVGTSFSWAIYLAITLLLVVACAPSSASRALEEVASDKIAYSSMYLTLMSFLISVLSFVLSDHSSVAKWVLDKIIPSIVSSIFGTFLTIMVAYLFIRPRKIFGFFVTMGYVVSFFALDNLNNIKLLFNVEKTSLVGSLISSNLLTFCSVLLTGVYFMHLYPKLREST